MREDAGATSPQLTDHQLCAQELVQAQESLQSADAQRSAECAALAEARRELERSGVGVTRLQAQQRVEAEERLCESNTGVVERLRTEVATLQSRCSQL
eukprot:CAMPEP_0168474522 /NCGR_PEP_ID=MMETSP0228-20121227/60889_1 /TAXON_ID=133427 /ORGANISM="Protoceratium reticulatum, Strain CCCM 535 (=CCMP 1889)" /LENGTH=97 /DNA_ID=CAMNT_0008490561 /DNA_START=18 /DNA_END=307 /DNA_ORIENTATION=+